MRDPCDNSFSKENGYKDFLPFSGLFRKNGF